MAVCRVEKNKNYTTMSNFHLRDPNLSNKARGLLSTMLSLPEDWDYTTRGLAKICKDGVDGITAQLKELEQYGYLIRHRIRDSNGRIVDMEYVIYERPHTASPDTEKPYMVKPDMDSPDTENPAQLNKDILNTQKSNTDQSNTHSFFPSESTYAPAAEGLTDGIFEREEIRDQIDYLAIGSRYDQTQLDELVEIMLEVKLNRSPTIKIGRDAEYPTSYVQQRFEQVSSMHIEKVMDGIRENTTRVWNTKAYLLAALFNSVSTIDNHYAMLVNHDFKCSP